MKEYPEIQGPNKAPVKPCIAFDKLDGSNLRFEWSKKKGWHKFGTRKTMFDQRHQTWGPAIKIFHEKYGEAITEIILSEKKYRNTRAITAFCEYWGVNSFAGMHDLNDKMNLTLFDINVNKFGIMSPNEFIKRFSHLDIPRVIFKGNFGEQFKQDVYLGKYPEITFEGIVAKGGESHNLWMAKMKTKAWLDKVKILHPRMYDAGDDISCTTNY